MRCPAPIPCLSVPPRTPPPRNVLNSMAVQCVHECNDAVQGLQQLVDHGLPEKASEEAVCVSFAMQVYNALTHLAALEHDEKKETPAKLGDVLLTAGHRQFNRDYRSVRAGVSKVLNSEDWPLLGSGVTLDSQQFTRFVGDVLDFMYETRLVYIVEAAQATSQLSESERKKLAGSAAEANDMLMLAGLPKGQQAAVAALMASGKTFEEAVAAAESIEEPS